MPTFSMASAMTSRPAAPNGQSLSEPSQPPQENGGGTLHKQPSAYAIAMPQQPEDSVAVTVPPSAANVPPALASNTGLSQASTFQALSASAITVKEIPYIPLAVAKKTVDSMQRDMTSMKQRHIKALADVSSKFENVESSTRKAFEQMVVKLRAVTADEVTCLKKSVLEAEAESIRLKQGEAAAVAEAVSARQKHQEEVSRLQEAAATEAARHGEELSELRSSYEMQLAALNVEIKEAKAAIPPPAPVVEPGVPAAEVEADKQRYESLLKAREDVIASLENERRELQCAINELHDARASLQSRIADLEARLRDAHSNTAAAEQAQAAAAVAAEAELMQKLAAAEAAAAAIAAKALADATASAAEQQQLQQRQLAEQGAAEPQADAPRPAPAADGTEEGEGGEYKSLLVRLDPAKMGPAAYADRLASMVARAQEVIATGEQLWVEKRKRQALRGYQREAADLEAQLPLDTPLHETMHTCMVESEARIGEGLPAKAAFTLKQGIDVFIVDAQAEVDRVRATLPAGSAPGSTTVQVVVDDAAVQQSQAEVDALRKQLQQMREQNAARTLTTAMMISAAKGRPTHAAVTDAGSRPVSAASAAEDPASVALTRPATAIPMPSSFLQADDAAVSGTSVVDAMALRQALARAEAAEGRAAQLARELASARSDILQAAVAQQHSADDSSSPAMSGTAADVDQRALQLEAQLRAALGQLRSAQEDAEQARADAEEARRQAAEAQAMAAAAAAGSSNDVGDAGATGVDIDDDDDAAEEGDDAASQDGLEAETKPEVDLPTSPATPATRKGAASAVTPARASTSSVSKGLATPATTSKTAVAAAAPASSVASKPGAGDASAALKVKEHERTIKDLKGKIRQMEIAAARAAAAPAAKGGAGGGIDEKAMQEKLDKLKKDLEKKFKAEKDDADKESKKEIDAISKKLQKASAEVDAAKLQLASITAERDELKKRTGTMGELEKELSTLREKAEEAKVLAASLKQSTARTEELERLYREEQTLRKRYWNMIEDMKGKIRVYARARPMSQSELDRGNKEVTAFPDEATIEIDGDRGRKSFVFDHCFPPASTQDDVFSECEGLVQSAFDGYNVCVFAYGQTGSGKTHTMVGSSSSPGLTPRSVARLFELIEKAKDVYEVKVQGYMVELYNDSLVDLFWSGPKSAEPPKLEIKKDDKGVVTVKGATIKECPTYKAVMDLFDQGNANRHVGSTNMNATSSRSHLVFALLVDAFNKQTKKNSVGKVSFVDLAGSERVGKTGATADRLKEAQAINKSLSALGNVISALSTGEKFIPYRDNKLTQLMSDSLGGNAKTLMFVNLSPADYNSDESLSSLVYAARVKLITNSAEKQTETAEIQRLKKVIAQLRSGAKDVAVDVDIDDRGSASASSARTPGKELAAGAGSAVSDDAYNDGPIDS